MCVFVGQRAALLDDWALLNSNMFSVPHKRIEREFCMSTRTTCAYIANTNVRVPLKDMCMEASYPSFDERAGAAETLKKTKRQKGEVEKKKERRRKRDRYGYKFISRCFLF